MDNLTKKIVKFSNERDWDKFHSPENLVKDFVWDDAKGKEIW